MSRYTWPQERIRAIADAYKHTGEMIHRAAFDSEMAEYRNQLLSLDVSFEVGVQILNNLIKKEDEGILAHPKLTDSPLNTVPSTGPEKEK